ncbi:MAG: C39 family peptidase, partial [Oscillospiraceae bacterium]|nr:C39 family peptidase [Oscillospiraceae bacterium]
MARVMVEDVPFISQLVKYPTGCESVSAVMVLNWAGVGVTVDEFIDRYLAVGTAPYRDENGKLTGCDPWKEFPGDPRTE